MLILAWIRSVVLGFPVKNLFKNILRNVSPLQISSQPSIHSLDKQPGDQSSTWYAGRLEVKQLFKLHD